MPLRHLTPRDQHLFWQYGRGADVPVHEPLVHRAIERHAIAHPHAVAAEHHGATLTYGELDRYAGALAARLVREGVRPGDHVGLFARRSIPMLVGLFAVLKAGAAYVPQDIGRTPPAELAHVIRTARTRVILTQKEHVPRVPLPGGHRLIALDDPAPYDPGPGPLLPPHPDDGCCVLFVPGTAGRRAHGVTLTHRNIANLLLTEPGGLGIRPGDRVAQLLGIASGPAAWEILGCLTHGATLAIRGKDTDATARTATVLIATPALLSGIDPADCPHLRTVAVTGEPCPRPLADRWSRRTAFFHCRGPAEATLVTTMGRHTPVAGRPVAGRALPNNTVYVLGADRRALPVGETGEVWAGGDSVSAGYLGDDALNAERYAPDPFLGAGHAMFRTGDLGRWTPDGDLEHLGRPADRLGPPDKRPLLRLAGERTAATVTVTR
ncbi:AMP-binding protein [Streptomyces sp. NPDC001980]|uniref:AMP-binding protein n=1 Tax=Streptomyces sp. NPDC001980 TaxID=3157126 RepID=UPI0033305B01